MATPRWSGPGSKPRVGNGRGYKPGSPNMASVSNGNGGKKDPSKPKPSTPSTPTTPTAPATQAWTSTQQSAYELLAAELDSWGLGSLTGAVRQWLAEGIPNSEIPLRLQETNEYRTRFAGNEMLKQKGLGVLSPAEYLATERTYAEVMKQYGLPSGFYDDPSDFSKFIGGSISPSEVQTRVQMYADLSNRDDAATKEQLRSMGLSDGDILAFTMDPDRAAPLVQEKYRTAILGSAARRAGVVADNGYLTSLASRGVTEEQASQGYGAIAQAATAASALGSIYDEDYGLEDMQAEVFDNSGTSAKKRKRLASQERAAFGGSVGTAGAALRRSTSASY